MEDKLPHYIQLMRLDRPIGILLLLWPTLSALWIAAEGMPDLLVLMVFTLGVIVMRSAGCVINDYADRDIDGQVVRTMTRPLATGVLEAKDALRLFAVLAFVAFLLVLLLNNVHCRLVFSRNISFYEALYSFATSVFRGGFWLGYSDGLCSTNWSCTANCMAIIYCQCVVVDDLRYLLCDG